MSKHKDISKKIRPLGDRVVIREDSESQEHTTVSGILIPSSSREDRSGKRGEVVALGTGHTENGVHIPISVKVGDRVLFQWGDKIKVDGEEYSIVKESEILAVIN